MTNNVKYIGKKKKIKTIALQESVTVAMPTQFLQAAENSTCFPDMDQEAKRWVHNTDYKRSSTKETLFLHNSDHWESTLP